MKKLSIMMKKISDFIERIIKVVLAVTIATLFITVVLSVTTRNFNFPVVWLGELGTFSCIWAIFMGMALAYRQDLFPSVDIFHSLISTKTRSVLSVVYDVLILFFLFAVLWSSRIFLAHLQNSGQISPELRLPMIYAYLGPVLGYIFTAFFCLTSLVGKLEKKFTRKTSTEGAV
ncbi:MAG: TRAP transporter small permease subunit [Bacteroidetes bacterium]|nr:TRAP transporter small permease subunit [Bacteroidota bacterium]